MTSEKDIHKKNVLEYRRIFTKPEVVSKDFNNLDIVHEYNWKRYLNTIRNHTSSASQGKDNFYYYMPIAKCKEYYLQNKMIFSKLHMVGRFTIRGNESLLIDEKNTEAYVVLNLENCKRIPEVIGVLIRVYGFLSDIPKSVEKCGIFYVNLWEYVTNSDCDPDAFNDIRHIIESECIKM